MRNLGDMIAVDLLMTFRNSSQHQQPATQSNADTQKNNDQSHQEQGVLQSESIDLVCKKSHNKSTGC